MKDCFLLLSDEGKEGVLLFHQELGGESISAVGKLCPGVGVRSWCYHFSADVCHRLSINRKVPRVRDIAIFLKQNNHSTNIVGCNEC
jgi:hypothetical protein